MREGDAGHSGCVGDKRETWIGVDVEGRGGEGERFLTLVVGGEVLVRFEGEVVTTVEEEEEEDEARLDTVPYARAGRATYKGGKARSDVGGSLRRVRKAMLADMPHERQGGSSRGVRAQNQDMVWSEMVVVTA